MSADTAGAGKTCSKCGASLDPDSIFCQQCGARAEGTEEKPKAPVPTTKSGKEVEQWAMKASKGLKKTSWGVKLGIPIAILVIILIVVALLVIGSMHSPEAALKSYLENVKQGEYQTAYSQVVKGGVLTSEFYKNWQTTLSNQLGRLRDFQIVPKSKTNKLFGRLVVENEAQGHPFVVTYTYVDKSFDANVIVENAGGTWPFNKYKIRLSDQSTRIFARPLGANVIVDGQFVGIAKNQKSVQDVLALKNFPKSFNDVGDYVKHVTGAVQGFADDVKRILVDVNEIGGNVQTAFNKAGKGGEPWSDVVNSFKNAVESSKDLGGSVARLAVHVYWMFGGGDDGSVRASLERTEPVVELQNLPDGYHLVTVQMPGAETDQKDLYAPNDIEFDLTPTGKTENGLKTGMNNFYGEKAYAELTLDASGLPKVMAGTELEQENAAIYALIAKGQHVASSLTSLKFSEFKLLKENTATVETEEMWNFITYQGNTVVAQDIGAKRKVLYTMRWLDNTWKVIEHKDE